MQRYIVEKDTNKQITMMLQKQRPERKISVDDLTGVDPKRETVAAN